MLRLNKTEEKNNELLKGIYMKKIFGLFMEVIGICAYSWALTEISNYIKVINEKKKKLL